MGITEDIKVVRNDKITIEEIERKSERIVLSPGRRIKEAGICTDVVKIYDKFQSLVFAGHQCIGPRRNGFYAKLVSWKTVYPSHRRKYLPESIRRLKLQDIIPSSTRKTYRNV